MGTPNVQLIANNGNVNISTANSGLSGQGAMGAVLTAGTATGAGGTIIRSITIKAAQTTSLGMIRLFISNGSNTFLFREVMVPSVFQTSVVQTFSATITEPFTLQSGYVLYASTQNAESFNVIANGQDIIVCDC